jgi:hypothetical protein
MLFMKQDFIGNGIIIKLIKKIGIICLKKVLNKFHIDLAQQGFIQV